MNIFEKPIYFLESGTVVPKPYGIFHLVSVAITALITFLLIKYFKDCDDKTLRKLVLSFWIAFVILEIYKQTHMSFHFNDGDPYWDYQWYAFPFQFCSSPHFILPFVIFMKDGKVRDACISFMSFYCFVAGVSVFLVPTDVFTEVIGNNIQTMYHHGMQIVFGIYFMVHFRKKLSFKYLTSGLTVLASLIAVALALNVVIYKYFMANGIDETFNMFYISPFHECTLPVLNTVWHKLPYVPFVCVYFFGFILCALIMFTLFRVFTKGSRVGIRSRKARKLAYERDCVFYYGM